MTKWLERHPRRFAYAAMVLLCYVHTAEAAEPAKLAVQEDRIVLENDFLRAVIVPSKGASVESLIVKPDTKSVLAGPSFYESVVRPLGSQGSLLETPFSPEDGLRERSGDEVSVELSALCNPASFSKGGVGRKMRLPLPYVEVHDTSSVQLEKRYSLRHDASALQIDYRFTNTGKERVPLTFAVAASFGHPQMPMRCAVSTGRGAATFDASRAKALTYHYDTPNAWFAALLPGKRALVAQFDVARISCLHTASDGGALRAGVISTTKWMEPGQTVETRSMVAALNGLKNVSFAANGIAGHWQLVPPAAADRPSMSEDGVPLAPPAYAADGEEEIAGNLFLASSSGRKTQLALTRRLNCTDRQVGLAREEVVLRAGTAHRIPLSLKVNDRGTWLLRAAVSQAGKLVASGETPIDVGNRTGFFLPRSGVPKQGAVYEDFRYSGLQRMPPPHEIRGDWEPTPDHVSPHVKYAKPYARGPIKALFICPFETTRGIIELWERFDIEYDCAIVGLHGYSKYHKYYSVGADHAPADEIDRVKELLNRPHDVIVLGGYLWGWYPPEVQAELVRQFQDGTGILISSPYSLFGAFKDCEEKAEASEEFFPGDFCKVAVHKTEFEEERGRIAFVPIEYDLIRPQTWIGHAESEVERIGRALVWCARKEPEIAISTEECPRTGFNDELAEGELKVQLTHRGTGTFDGKLRLTARQHLVKQYRLIYGSLEYMARPYASWEPVAVASVAANVTGGGGAEVSLKMPWLRDGVYSLDFSLVDAEGRVASWYRRPLLVRSRVEVAEVWLGKDGWEASRADGRASLSKGKLGQCPIPRLPLHAADTLRVRAIVRKPEDYGAGELTATTVVVDRSEREFGQNSQQIAFKGKQAEVAFELPLGHALHLMNVLKVRVEGQGRVLSETRVPLPIHTRPERTCDYKLRVYGYSVRQPDKTGVDIRSGIMYPVGCLMHAWIDQGMECWGHWLVRASEITSDFVRIPCLTNPDFRERQKASIRGNFSSMIAFVPPRAVLADEWTYCQSIEGAGAAAQLSQCRCRYCLERFQRYLRVQYWTLENLNRTWGTGFKSWAEATPPVFDSTGLRSLSEEKLPQVLDHRCFIDEQVGEFVGFMNDAVHKLDPGCEIGISGNEPITPWNNLDIWQLAKNGKHNIVYRYHSMWESFGVIGVSQWQGYAGKYSPAGEHARVWRSFLTGRSISYYGKDNTPIWRPDFGFLAGPAELFRAVKAVKNGPAQLLWGRQARDPVALVYHTRSIYADMMEKQVRVGGRAGPRVRERGSNALHAGSSYERLLSRFLVQPYWVSYEQLQKAYWEEHEQTKLIFLPYTTALRSDEAETIKQLVERGATVVADVNVGTRDGHGKQQKVGSLDEVFGIERTGEWAYPVFRTAKDDPNTRVRFTIDGVAPFTMSFRAVAPPNITTTTAKPYAKYRVGKRETPAVLVNSYGKGKAILLNFLPCNYYVVESGGFGGEIAIETSAKPDAAWRFETIMGWVLRQAGVQPPLSILVNGKPGSPNAFRRFRDGRLVYLGFCGPRRMTPKQYGQRQEKASLDRKYHLYDILAGKYLGFAKEISVQYKVLDFARLFACLPYKVEGVNVSLAKAAWRPGEVVTFSAGVAATEALRESDCHVLRVEVLDPEGNERTLYRYFVRAKGGKGVGEIPLAANDLVGKWQLRVTDVATGVSETTEFRVQR